MMRFVLLKGFNILARTWIFSMLTQKLNNMYIYMAVLFHARANQVFLLNTLNCALSV